MGCGTDGRRAALIAGALALWLSAGQPSEAATAPQVQGTTISVPGKAISWAANGQCAVLRDFSDPNTPPVPGPDVTADFGASPPGGGLAVTGMFSGCVNSNATWNVDAVATPLTSPLDSDGDGLLDSIQATNMALKAFPLDGTSWGGPGVANDPIPAPIAPACTGAAACSLGATRPIVTGAAPSPQSSGFVYQYLLTVPSSTPAGTYTGSVTFTASN